jgi:hypothetical protein
VGELRTIFAHLTPTCLQVRHGIFQHQAIINTMLVYYGRQGTKACIPTASVPGEDPIGVLALVCTAVRPSHTTALFNTNAGSLRLSVRYRCTPWGFSSRAEILSLKNFGGTVLLSM